MSRERTPTADDLDLAASIFRIFQLFKVVTIDASRNCALGSPERARMLWTLKAAPARAGWIAQQARISPSAVTEIVEGLERDGLVKREDDPDDRRAVRVALTVEGRRQLQRFEQAAAAALAERLAPLSPSQRQRIRAAMNDLREILPQDFTIGSHPDATLRGDKPHKEIAHAR